MESMTLQVAEQKGSTGKGSAGPSLVRRVAPGVAGFIAIAVLSHATDSALRAAGVFSALGLPMTSGLFVLATAYRSAFGALGCFIAARLAPRQPMRTALWLGAVGFVLSVLGVVATVHRPELGPLWYPIVLAALTLPSAWLGGKLGSAAQTQTHI